MVYRVYSVFNLHFMKVSTENDNNIGYEKITILVYNIPLNNIIKKKLVKRANLGHGSL
jgi:hypothetical protein